MNDSGIELFRQYILDLREGRIVEKPELNDGYSSEYHVPCDLEQHPYFQSKMEMAKYLLSKFENAGIMREEIVYNKGLWTWLGYFWFELLAKDKSGKLCPGLNYRYIFSSEWNTHYRHFVWLPYDLIAMHKDEESLSLFLWNPINVQGELSEQFAARNSTYINTEVVKAAATLYLDRISGKPKRGAGGKEDRPGTFRRFIMVLKQFERTYDIVSAEAHELVDLLPKEFKRWTGE